MVKSVEKVVDPLGKVSMATELDDGLELYRVGCPIGVLCIIFESRPDALVQIASLAIKSGNAVILKGGKEAIHTNQALHKAFQEALATTKVPVDAVQLVSTREEVSALLSLDQYIDLVIPRGSNAMVKNIMNSTKIPVMGHADGICSVFVDKDAALDKAVDVVVDSKSQYTAVCNATETLLVHEGVLDTMLPKLVEALAAKDVQLKMDEKSLAAIQASPVQKELVAKHCAPSTPEDYDTEFLDLILAVKCVSGVEDAIAHINCHGSGHTDCIVTENPDTAEKFIHFLFFF